MTWKRGNDNDGVRVINAQPLHIVTYCRGNMCLSTCLVGRGGEVCGKGKGCQVYKSKLKKSSLFSHITGPCFSLATYYVVTFSKV